MTQDFCMLKLRQSLKNLECVDHLSQWATGSRSFWRSSERMHRTQLRIISKKRQESIYPSRFNPQWLREGHSKALSVIYSPSDLRVLLPPGNAVQERHRKMLACLRSIYRQTLGSPTRVIAGGQHHLTHDYFCHSHRQRNDFNIILIWIL